MTANAKILSDKIERLKEGQQQVLEGLELILQSDVVGIETYVSVKDTLKETLYGISTEIGRLSHQLDVELSNE